MPFKDKDKEREYRRLQKRRQRAMSHPEMSHPVSTKCSLPNCIICHPEKYQPWFKKTFGRYDTHLEKNQSIFYLGGN